MTRIKWEGIPEKFWPDTEKPWRVSWGFGVFEDFATREEAQAFYEEKVAADTRQGGGWERLVQEPFDAVKGRTQ